MITIGRNDKADLPEFGIFDLDVKIDTGAYGSTLHCHHIEINKKDGKEVLTFDLLDPEHPEYEEKFFSFEKFGDKVVRSANGQTEHRYTIKSKLILFEKEYTVEFSLTNRIEMKSPVLLGRQFLYKRFLVDVNQKNISYKLKIKNS